MCCFENNPQPVIKPQVVKKKKKAVKISKERK